MDHTKQLRILAISLTSRGFGFAVMEGEKRLVDYGNKVFQQNKNKGVVSHIERMVERNVPHVLVLQDVKQRRTHRWPRIKELDRLVVALAKKRRLKVVKICDREMREVLLGNKRGTKYEMALKLAAQFPDELALRLPPKRTPWTSEDARMDIFDAIAVGLAYFHLCRTNLRSATVELSEGLK